MEQIVPNPESIPMPIRFAGHPSGSSGGFPGIVEQNDEQSSNEPVPVETAEQLAHRKHVQNIIDESNRHSRMKAIGDTYRQAEKDGSYVPKTVVVKPAAVSETPSSSSHLALALPVYNSG